MEDNQVNLYKNKIGRRLKANQMERNVRRQKLLFQRLRVLVRLVLIILLIYCGYRVADSSKWFLSASTFNSIDNPYLKIQGNEITPGYKILQVLRQTPLERKPVYLLDTNVLSDKILEKDPVRRVYIRRYWFPARLQILIEERKPILTIAPSETVPPIAFFTEDGKLIGREYMPLKKHFKTTLILTSGSLGDDYRHWDLKKITMIDKLAKKITALSGENIQYLDLRNPRDVYVKLDSVYIRLGELDDTVLNRIKWLNSIIPKLKATDTKVKYIDLRWEDSSYLKKLN